LTPPWLHFEVLTARPIVMATGSVIDYKLRIRGLPVRWQSKITAWEPPLRFVDEQVRGPYSLWVHEHVFRDGNGGTIAEDHIRYSVPGGALFHLLFVRRDVERIFAFRKRKMQELFGCAPEPGSAQAA
jgi:ligand-binding SRPBCC domain-containing protein